eukprot:TRINITY_DN59940_c0_g1_i1.p1 TRINITY_DN59940_c0_g1~~TRINITY_DN59940_c0_g1_i1.p1  ORF type:complete len:608 (+),score=159.04 TRINITY_DN59940_c0_g1_i1:110-1825(+)
MLGQHPQETPKLSSGGSPTGTVMTPPSSHFSGGGVLSYRYSPQDRELHDRHHHHGGQFNNKPSIGRSHYDNASPQGRWGPRRRRSGHYDEHHEHWCSCRTMTWVCFSTAVLLLGGFWYVARYDNEVQRAHRKIVKEQTAMVLPPSKAEPLQAAVRLPPPRTAKTQQVTAPPQHHAVAATRAAPKQLGGQTQVRSGIAARAEPWAGRPTVIVTFGSIKYTASLTNWLAFAVDRGVTNWAVVCLDLELGPWLQERGANCHAVLTAWKHGVWADPEYGRSCEGESGPAPTLALCRRACEYDPAAKCKMVSYDSAKQTCTRCTTTDSFGHEAAALYRKRTRDTLWFARWQLLVRLLNEGLDVLLSDADAIVLQNPKEAVIAATSQDPGADIVAQRGSFPDWVSAVWGAALCMGFGMWRSTEATKRFAVYMHGVILNTGDDQVAVNVALQQLGMQWSEGTVLYANSTATSYGRTSEGFTVGLLPHSAFPRRCAGMDVSAFKPGGAVVVAHCFQSSKTGDAKKKEAQGHGLWMLKDDWETAPAIADLTKYLSSVRVPPLPPGGPAGAAAGTAQGAAK